MESPFVETQILTEHKWTWKIVTQNSISAIVVIFIFLDRTKRSMLEKNKNHQKEAYVHTNGFVPDSHNGYPKITPVSQPGRLSGLK